MSQNHRKVNIVNRNATLAVNLCERPSSDTIILLHGGPGVPDEMTEVRNWLCQHFQVISFDQRGIGPSENEDITFTMEDYLDDINCIASNFSVDRFHLFGHSWGGLLGQLYASKFPEQLLSLFLCSPASGFGKEWKIAEREIFKYNFRRSTIPEWIKMSIDTIRGMMGSKKAYRSLFKQIIINYHKGFGVDPPDDQKLSRISSMGGTKTRHEIRKHPPLKHFGKTPFRVMITYGESDAFGRSRRFVLDRFPEATTTIIPASGHTPWKHNLPEFEKVLHSFYLM